MARLPAGVAAIGSWASTIRITAESSVSGNQSLANSKAQPPGSSSGFRIDQSPGRKIWFATSHSAARASIGCAGSMPDSSSAFMASAVSQVGETHGWYMSRSEEHTSELQSRSDLVCRLLLEKKKNIKSAFVNKHSFPFISPSHNASQPFY